MLKLVMAVPIVRALEIMSMMGFLYFLSQRELDTRGHHARTQILKCHSRAM